MTVLVERVSERLAEAGLKLSVAESCTGGLLCALLTERPGASRFLVASLVTYSDGAKEKLLGVRPGTLATHGAVSEPAVREMAAGARRITEADAAMAITGIAGPGGGTPEKPVGTVWIAAEFRDRTVARLFHFPGSRQAVRTASVRAALEMLDALMGQDA